MLSDSALREHASGGGEAGGWSIAAGGLALPAGLGVATALLHVATTSDSYGLFRDELYYLANAEHLSFGYVDHPPLIGVVAWLSRSLFGESMTGLRLLPALAAGVTVVLVCLMVRSLGGGRFAQLLAGLATALAPVYLALFGYLSMNAFDVAFWAALWLVLIILLRTGRMRLWPVFGVIAGVALQNKISPLFLGFGVVVGLLLTRDWRHFRSRELWLGGAIAAALFLPYVIWQWLHSWPLLVFMANASRFKNVSLSPAAFLAEQGLHMNPVMAPLAVAGLLFLLVARQGRPYRALGWAVLAVLAVMIGGSAKAYYFSPTYTLLFAAGGVGVEALTSRGWRRWLRPVAVVAGLSGAVLLPLAKPVLPVERFVAYQAALGLEPGSDERHEVGRLPQFFADRLGWRELAEEVAAVYHRLSSPDRTRACVFGENYGQAGAIDFYGRPLGLPPALSGHNSYHIWGPRSCTGEVVIVIGSERDDLERFFGSVTLAATFRCDDCMPYEDDKPIWVCRDPRLSLAEVWPGIASFN